jgi:sec-independent protein translocase protein TatC
MRQIKTPRTEAPKIESEELPGMSLLGHLEELRSRVLRCLTGVALAVALSFTFSDPLWDFVKQPAKAALLAAGQPPQLMQTDSMEVLTVLWFKLPLVCAVFLASPWVLYQLWAFIAPGLYRHEKRWAAPFMLGSAGLFIAGGVFGYFVVFRYGLTFLLSVGKGRDVTPGITVTDYFDKFVNVILGVGVSFELPVLIMLLVMLGVATPGFLLRHSRYAIIAIAIVAAVITPTTDPFNFLLVAGPLWALFFVGIGASYLVTLRREGRGIPRKALVGIGVGGLAAILYWWYELSGRRLTGQWPFLVKEAR